MSSPPATRKKCSNLAIHVAVIIAVTVPAFEPDGNHRAGRRRSLDGRQYRSDLCGSRAVPGPARAAPSASARNAYSFAPTIGGTGSGCLGGDPGDPQGPGREGAPPPPRSPRDPRDPHAGRTPPPWG